MGELIRIKASAGAGKTYALSVRFLKLLSKFNPPSAEEAGRILSSIVAITFTNKAAAEMKERILRFLKEIALDTEEGRRLREEEGIGLSPQEARIWIEGILENYTSFQVRTIDSLLFSILKALSFELGLRTEMNVVFGIDDPFDAAFDELLSLIPEEKELWEELLTSFLELDEMGGFYPEKPLRDRLKEVFEPFYTEHLRHRDWTSLRDEARKKANERFKEFCRVIEPHKASLDGRRVKNVNSWLREDSDIEKVWNYALFDPNRKLKDFFKSSEVPVEKIERARNRLIEAVQEYAFAICASKVSGYSRAIARLREIFNDICRREGIILGGEDWTRLVRDRIREEGVIPLVYAYFGARFVHFLFDEFQDTSRAQWETLLPVVEDALSHRGSLFLVGDVKQAIYRWRGGDWRLFDEVFRYFPSVEKPEKKVLDTNYRSEKEMVEFFNNFFSEIGEKGAFEGAFRSRGRAPLWAKRAEEFISDAFSDCEQKSKKEGEASIKLFAVKGDNLEERLPILRDKFLAEIRRVWSNRAPHETVAVLVRRNSEGEDVSGWLISEGIPVVTENALKIGASAVVKGILGALSYLHRGDEFGLYAFLASGLFDEWNETGGEKRLEVLWLDGAKRNRLENSVKEKLKRVFEETGRLSPYELAVAVLEEFGGLEKLEGELSHHTPFVERLLEVIHLFEVEEGPNLGRFLEFMESGGLEKRIGLPETIDAVRVMTIHKAKGLEFDHVFIPFASWGDLKSPLCASDGTILHLGSAADKHPELQNKKHELYAHEVFESVNLLYVAFTRAIKGLYVFVHVGGRKQAVISKLVPYIANRAGVELEECNGKKS